MELQTRSLTNGKIRIDYLTSAGPRITRLSLEPDGANVLAELPEAGWDTPFGRFNMFGGHRLWHSPEAFPRTSLPDNDPPRIEELPGGVKITQKAASADLITKSLEVRLEPGKAKASVEHTLKNEGLWEVELAPWGITQCALGGTAVMPQIVPDFDPALLLPNRKLVLWAYTRWTDPRLELHDDMILVDARALMPPIKIGCPNPSGWLAYVTPTTVFIKRFSFDPSAAYPDLGCNAEIYCNDQFLELESLGPLTRLEPGCSVSHTETWELFPTPPELIGATSLVERIRELTFSMPR